MGKGIGLQAGRALLVLCGLWLAVSPWIATYARHAHAVQDTIVGVLVLIAAIASAVAGPSTGAPLWIALLLGLWMFITPMMFGQAGESFSANNDVIAGMLIVVVSAIALVSRARLRLFATPADPHAASEQTSLW
jgi:hypothetical protein